SSGASSNTPPQTAHRYSLAVGSPLILPSSMRELEPLRPAGRSRAGRSRYILLYISEKPYQHATGRNDVSARSLSRNFRRNPIMTTQAPIQYPDMLFIDGRWTKPSSTATIDVINSATEELYTRVAEAKEIDVNRAVEAARKAFDRGPWPRMSHTER